MPRTRRASTVTSVGLAHPTFKINATNRTGANAVYGQLVMLDYALSDGDVSNFTEGDENGAYANFVVPTSAGCSTGRAVFGIVNKVTGISDDEAGEILLQGRTSIALVYASAGSISTGDLLWGDPTQEALEWNGTGETGYVYLARAEEDVTTPSTATAAKVLFDGIDFSWGVVP